MIAQQLITASQNLLAGMKTAFVTSLFGMGAAIFFILYLSWEERKRTKIRNDWRKELSKIAFVETPNHLLSRLDNEGNIEVAKTLQSVADNLSGFNADVIAIAIKNAIAPIVSEIKSLEKIDRLIDNTSSLSNLTPKAIASATTDKFTLLINPISEEIRQLRELLESQGQTVESLVKQLRNELIEPVVTRLDQSAALTKEASAAVTDLKNELGGISQSLAGAVETIQSFQQDTLIRLQEFAANLQSILGQFRTDTQGVMEQVAVKIQQAVNQSITGMEAQRVEHSYQSMTEQFNKALQNGNEKLIKQKILTSGRGEIDANQSKDNSSDRKVVFRFQFRREDFGELLKRADTVQKSVIK